MRNRIKRISKQILYHLPFKLRYVIDFYLAKGRLPRVFTPKDYSDFIAKDNFWGNHIKHAYLADKLEVRKYVEKRGLGDILIPLLGYWDSASSVDFDSLPKQFAIKCNHSCAMNIICYDKSLLDIETTRKQLDSWLRTKHPIYYERHYFSIKPYILAEALIPSNSDGYFPTDYKIHCACGKPVFIQCCIERSKESVGKRVLYDANWNKLPYIINDYHYTDEDVERPKHLKEMLEVASILSKGLDYARIDLYETDNGVLFPV